MRKFKDLSTWRKGGMISICLYALLNVLPMIVTSIQSNETIMHLIYFVNAFPQALFGYMGFVYILPMIIYFYLMLAFGAIFYYIVGAILGWIYGKSKNRV